MRFWRDREVSDRLQSARAYRKEARNRELPSCIGFDLDRTEDDYDID